MTQEELLDCLTGKLLPAQFDVLLVKLQIPAQYIPSAQAPQATRAVDVVRYIVGQGLLAVAAAVVAALLADTAPNLSPAQPEKRSKRAPRPPRSRSPGAVRARGVRGWGIGGIVSLVVAGIGVLGAVVCGIAMLVEFMKASKT